MPKVITDEKLIDIFLERGVETVFPSKEAFKEKLLSGQRLRVYCGFDPSASSLHIGNAILINKLAQFQQLGHEVIFLVGDFTGMIGDPTDKKATRRKLTREEVLENSKNYQKQAEAFLSFSGESAAQVRYNSEWSDKITFKDLIELASNFTVQQMIQRDMFQERLKEEKPIHLHEFLYPLAQGYDSVAMDVDVEIGGNDQMFNMLCGRDLQRVINNTEKFVLTMKLLADKEGKKMGKSEGNVVWMDDSPENMYGKVMSWPDGVIGIGLELCTDVSLEEVEKVYKELEKPEVNPRDLKMKLAYEITRIIWKEEKAKEAQEYFVRTIQKKEIPEDVKEVSIAEGEKLIDLLAREGLAPSKSEAKRKIEQGGVSIDGKQIDDTQFFLGKDHDGKVIKAGKRDFRRIKISK